MMSSMQQLTTVQQGLLVVVVALKHDASFLVMKLLYLAFF